MFQSCTIQSYQEYRTSALATTLHNSLALTIPPSKITTFIFTAPGLPFKSYHSLTPNEHANQPFLTVSQSNSHPPLYLFLGSLYQSFDDQLQIHRLNSYPYKYFIMACYGSLWSFMSKFMFIFSRRQVGVSLNESTILINYVRMPSVDLYQPH